MKVKILRPTVLKGKVLRPGVHDMDPGDFATLQLAGQKPEAVEATAEEPKTAKPEKK